jgi:hypothetical protein
MVTRSSSTRSSASRGRNTPKNQIVEMLKADHKKVKKAFKDFEKLDPQEDPQRCQMLVEQTLAEIEVHAQLEEQIFYPAAREAIKEAELIDEAEVEHMTAKVLIEQLKGMNAEDEKFAATFKVLGEYINHHVKEEEGEMFKQMTRSGVDWESVLLQMQEQRVALLEDKGLPAEGEAEQAGEAAMSGSRRAAPAGRGSARGAGEARPQASGRSNKTSGSEEE